MDDYVILVDEKDNEIGTEEKLAAHQNGGKLHRAFSIFIFNSKEEMLLQQRSAKKYHFGELWSNTCCSHPRKGEFVEQAAHRRLKEEFGFDCLLYEKFSMIYKADDKKSGLTEHEFDHILIGKFDGTPDPNPEEIGNFKWITMSELKNDVETNSEKYTPWFKIILNKLSL